MSFVVAPDAYERYMGRYSEPLAVGFADALRLHAGQRALDVGCGPGALTAVLVERLGAGAIAAIDPSEPFVAAARSRLPGVDIRHAVAEHLPFDDDDFDVAAAQLVVHFMANAGAGLAEMARVTRSGGVVAACVWDHAGGREPLSPLWRAVYDLDPDAPGESDRPGSRAGELAELFAAAGLRHIRSSELRVTVAYPTFDDWWEPMMLGVGPAGTYVAGLDDERRAALRTHCAELQPPAPFEITAIAWSAVGVVG
jgi:SAM-dependent methyltransferase